MRFPPAAVPRQRCRAGDKTAGTTRVQSKRSLNPRDSASSGLPGYAQRLPRSQPGAGPPETHAAARLDAKASKRRSTRRYGAAVGVVLLPTHSAARSTRGVRGAADAIA